MDTAKLYQEYLDSQGVCIDTRLMVKGQIFFALPGAHVNGGLFATQAITQGAKLAVVESPEYADDTRKIIYVPSVLKALQDLACMHRAHLNIPVIAITGSVAKTTTKELIHAVLQTTFRVKATHGNLNNHIGVPLTVLAIGLDTQIAIVEMGANHIGEIEELCTIAQPTHGLITKIGKAHLEGFGSMEGVIIAKSDLYRFLQNHQGVAFINDKDELLMNVSKGFKMVKAFYSSIVTTELISAKPNLKLKFGFQESSIVVQTQLPGIYNQDNFSVAAAVGAYFNVSALNIQSGLQSYQSSSNRSQRICIDTNEFLLDAYNANPLSMSAAIQSFVAQDTVLKKVLVLGEMKELGEARREEHLKIMALVDQSDWHIVCLVGPTFKEIGSAKSNYLFFEDVQELKNWYTQQLFDHTLFLIKASRSMFLEKMISDIIPDSIH